MFKPIYFALLVLSALIGFYGAAVAQPVAVPSPPPADGQPRLLTPYNATP